MTKVEAIKRVMKDNDGLASWSLIYDKIELYYPNAKQSKEWKAGIRGVLYRDLDKTFKKLDDGLFSILEFKEEKYIKENILEVTEKETITKTRIGQSFFRKSLLNSLELCPFTNINNPYLLVASHIKPWAISDNVERLDINNGFIFTPTFDLLFDNGYISFKNDKSLIISSLLDKNSMNSLKLANLTKIELLPISGRELYLEYHRDIILKRAS